MGRKTKREKIIADLRRELSQVKTDIQLPKVVDQTRAFEKKITIEPIQSVNTFPHQSNSIYTYPTQLIKKDLTKTIILAILAISFELALFFFFEGKISLPIKIINLPIRKFSLPISFSFF